MTSVTSVVNNTAIKWSMMTKEARRDCVKLFIAKLAPYILLGVVVCLYFVLNGMTVSAASKSQASSAQGTAAITLVMKVIRAMATVVGALFIAVGVVKFTVAHANEDGPNQQKAAFMIAAGIGLFLVSVLLTTDTFLNMINFSGEES